MDIVVAGMTGEDWRTVLKYFRERPATWTRCVDFEKVDALTANGAPIDFDDRGLLARGDLPGQLNAWFLGDELEIDLDPRLVTQDEQLVALLGFMRELGQLLQRDVAMSWEGSRDAVNFRYWHTTDTLEGTRRD